MYQEVIMTGDQLIFLDQADEIKHFLCASHREGRDDNIAAPVECPLDHARQLFYVVRLFFSVGTVAVGRLHYNVVC